jgi:hypothetical protein
MTTKILATVNLITRKNLKENLKLGYRTSIRVKKVLILEIE